ncbi:MAG: SGNH/GDSL hydrolase family protein [bacterium]|nr:SGNH/GDSL hydrolase family protein [bacterium]
MGFGRRLPAHLVYAAWLCVVVAVVWCLHRRWLGRVRPARPPADRTIAGIDDATVARLGWLHAPARRASSFANFPPVPPAGVRRIGCYGDSLTWGTEVADGFEFPAQLGAELHARGVRDVEVLDFGVPGYGLHQTAILHAATAARWQVGRTVLFAHWFWPERDWAFTPPWDADRAVHARFVADGDDVRIVDPPGATLAERIARYQAFLPTWRYLRFDARPRSCAPSCPPGARSRIRSSPAPRPPMRRRA